MKPTLVFLLIHLTLITKFSAQNSEWMNFPTIQKVFGVVSSENDVWIGTNGGLIKLNKTTESLSYYTKGNANLPGNEIRSMSMDSSGYLWIGTQYDGIGRFDGNTCHVYNHLNSRLPNDQLNTSIKVDYQGNIWVGSANHLIKIDKNNSEDTYWNIFRVENLISPYPAIFDIEFDNNDVVWIGAHWGLSRLFQDTIQTNYDGFRTVTWAVKKDFNDNLWVGTQYNGIYRYDGSNWINYTTTNSSLPSNEIFNLTLDLNGNIWAASGGGLVEFDGEEWKTYNGENSELPSNVLLSLEIDGQFIWIGHLENYLSKFDLVSKEVIKTYELSNSSITNNRVESIAEDSNSNIWISSYYSLSKYNGKEWFAYDTTNFELLDQSFTRVFEDSLMILWKGTDLMILLKDYSEWVVAETSNKHTGGKLKEDYNGNIWFASDQGLEKFDGSSWTIYNTNNSPIPTNNIAKFSFDKENNMLVSTMPDFGEKGLLVKFDGASWSTFYICEEDHDWIAGLEIDSLDNIWIGILNRGGVSVENGGGLKKYNGSEWISYDIYTSGLPSNSVVQLCLDNKENIWIGTYDGGVAKFDGEENWIVYNKLNSGLPSNNVERITVDKNNNKWFGLQNSGLTVFNEEGIDLTDIKEEKVDQLPKNYILAQNYPNPFNPTTTIFYFLPEQTHVSLKIFDLLGCEIAELLNETKHAGKHEVIFDGSKFSSGVYFYSIETANYSDTKKLVLLK